MVKCLKCGYNWVTRVSVPKACPRCKSRQDSLNNTNKEEVEDN